MSVQYMSNGINSSPTVAIPAADEMKNPAGKAVKYDGNGKCILCDTAGEMAVGVVTIDNDNEVQKDDTVSVQIKDMGLVKLAADVSRNDELTTDANGEFIKAESGNYVRAIATSNGSKGTMCSVRLCDYKA